MNDQIWQETHKDEFKKKQEDEAKKKQEEEKYAAEVQQHMNQLKEEVNLNIEEFLNTSQAIKEDTA